MGKQGTPLSHYSLAFWLKWFNSAVTGTLPHSCITFNKPNRAFLLPNTVPGLDIQRYHHCPKGTQSRWRIEGKTDSSVGRWWWGLHRG